MVLSIGETVSEKSCNRTVRVTVVLSEPLTPMTSKFSGFAIAALRLLSVSVLDCPAKIVAGEKEQVNETGQPRVMLPAKLPAAAADTGKVAVVEPTTIVDFGAEDESVNSAMPVPDSATVCGLPLALSAIESVPGRAPLATGWKVTLAEQLSPTLSKLLKSERQVSVNR